MSQHRNLHLNDIFKNSFGLRHTLDTGLTVWDEKFCTNLESHDFNSSPSKEVSPSHWTCKDIAVHG